MTAEELIEGMARAAAERAGFAWEACAQSQWIADQRAAFRYLLAHVSAEDVMRLREELK